MARHIDMNPSPEVLAPVAVSQHHFPGPEQPVHVNSRPTSVRREPADQIPVSPLILSRPIQRASITVFPVTAILSALKPLGHEILAAQRRRAKWWAPMRPVI